MTQLSSRQHTRVDFRVPIEILTQPGERPIVGRSLDLSEGGMRIAGPLHLEVGDNVTCAVTLDGRATALSARVAWVDRELPAEGIGVCWDGLGTRDSHALRHIVGRAREGYRRVELHFADIEGPVFARARPTDDGVRLSVALPILEEGARVSFRLDADAPLLQARVGAVSIERVGESRRLCIDVAAGANDAVRGRKHTQYGYEGEVGHDRRPPAPRAASPLRAQRRSDGAASASWWSWRWAVAALLATTGSVVAWGAFTGRPPVHVVRPAPAVATATTATSTTTASGAGDATTATSTTTAGGAGGTAAGTHSALPEGIQAPHDPLFLTGEPPTGETPAGEPLAPGPARPAASAQGKAAATPPSPTATPRPTAQVAGRITQLAIPFTGSLDGMQSRLWANPHAIALDLPAASDALATGRYRVGTGGVSYIRLNRRGHATLVRVMLEQPIESYSVTGGDGELRIRIDRRQ